MHNIKPNLFPYGPPSQSLNTYIISCLIDSVPGLHRQVEYLTPICFSLMMKKEIFMRSADWVRANLIALTL